LLPVYREFEVVTTRSFHTPLPVPTAKAGCPIQAVFWLEWDNTALALLVERANLVIKSKRPAGWRAFSIHMKQRS
jgi:hypothetical protein